MIDAAETQVWTVWLDRDQKIASFHAVRAMTSATSGTIATSSTTWRTCKTAVTCFSEHT